MGVFARLFRRSKTTEETRAAEAGTEGAQADRATTGTGTDEAAGTSEAREPAETPAAEPEVKETGGAAGTESVDIPKQQSSETAGSEAGEGART